LVAPTATPAEFVRRKEALATIGRASESRHPIARLAVVLVMVTSKFVAVSIATVRTGVATAAVILVDSGAADCTIKD
jgi:hypothetical protein